MLTPRSTLTRRVIAALDASPSRIPVLLGGCGTGRTTLLHQLRDRIGRTSTQYIDVERTATTPERFLRAVTSTSPFPSGDQAIPRARPAAAARPVGSLRSHSYTATYGGRHAGPDQPGRRRIGRRDRPARGRIRGAYGPGAHRGTAHVRGGDCRGTRRHARPRRQRCDERARRAP